MSVRLLKAAIDIFKPTVEGAEETIILRGVISPESLNEILVDSYQREILSAAKIRDLSRAIETSTVPDVELGMRGDKHQVRNPDTDDEVYILQDPVFVIDGLQRITAGRQLLQENRDSAPRLGAVVHFDTTPAWEKERFRILNQERTRLDVNVYLRNMRTEHDSIDMIYKLCEDSSFVLHARVKWQQNMLRTQIIPALSLCKVTGVLHSQFGPGRTNQCNELANALDTTMAVVGRTTMRDNLKTFFELIDECFGVRRIVFAHGAMHMRGNFLLALADILTRHLDFWRGNRLFIEQDLKRKIAKLPINDPEVGRLCSSSGKAREILYQIILDHINSGKRTRRLRRVDGVVPETETNGLAESIAT